MIFQTRSERKSVATHGLPDATGDYECTAWWSQPFSLQVSDRLFQILAKLMDQS